MKLRPTHALFAASLLFVLGCDHATKCGAKSELGGGRVVELVPNVLDLRYVENHDVAFSLLGRTGLDEGRGALGLLALLTVLVVSALWWQRRAVATRIEHAGFGLAIVGGLGNLLDRLTRGYVVDFIHLHRWPVFNVADVAIAIGMALVLVGSWRRPSAASPPEPMTE